MSDLIKLTYTDNKRLEEWTEPYIDYDTGQLESINKQVDHLKEKLFGLAQLLVQHGVCSVDDILDT